jgi:hypothetical protein
MTASDCWGFSLVTGAQVTVEAGAGDARGLENLRDGEPWS